MPELFFKGKEFVYNHHLAVPHRPLAPRPERSIGKPRLDDNLIIHGDNLHALKALLPLYATQSSFHRWMIGCESWRWFADHGGKQQLGLTNIKPPPVADPSRPAADIDREQPDERGRDQGIPSAALAGPADLVMRVRHGRASSRNLSAQ
ncbi:hypothetical protein [Halochromatium glycolicum]|uniref:hypothetical protein n=1 Tax=Halochromatium glycolicum TaxID=85075 RepID=UPI00190BB7B1|nr:hypothetical protein [Halochromatium glycolicum]